MAELAPPLARNTSGQRCWSCHMRCDCCKKQNKRQPKPSSLAPGPPVRRVSGSGWSTSRRYVPSSQRNYYYYIAGLYRCVITRLMTSRRPRQTGAAPSSHSATHTLAHSVAVSLSKPESRRDQISMWMINPSISQPMCYFFSPI